MDFKSGKAGLSKGRAGCSGWTLVLLSLAFFSGVLVGSILSGSKHGQTWHGSAMQAQQQPLPQESLQQASTSTGSYAHMASSNAVSTETMPQLSGSPSQQSSEPSDISFQTSAAPASSRAIFAADLRALSRLNSQILAQTLDTANCEPQEFGAGWGTHHLCTKQAPSKPCHFYSFGVQSDYSFDVAVAKTWGCTGFAADPTVVHNSTLHPGVTFHNIAANSPWASTQAADKWILTSVPALRKWLRHDRIAVLKMDCEGCEYSLAADVLAEDPVFFTRVDQFAIEVHWSRMWMKSKAEMYALASLFELLENAGLKLMHANLTPCGTFAARTGLLPELKDYMSVLFAPGPQVHCQNYLFARGSPASS